MEKIFFFTVSHSKLLVDCDGCGAAAAAAVCRGGVLMTAV
jgi:hypothetical protein